VNYDHFKAFLLFGVKLRTSSDFLDQLLDDDSVVLVSFTWGHLDVVNRAKNNAAASGR
jgi:hypothetical protein